MEAKDRANVRKRPAPRSRLEKPAGYHGLIWKESVHEGGHALAGFLLGLSVSHVWLPGPLGGVPSVHLHWRPYDDSPEKSALCDAAGAGAERARGLHSAAPSPGDRANFCERMGRGVPMEGYVTAAEALFRLPAIAPLLTQTAELLYQRHGATSASALVLGRDLLAVLPEDLDEAMELADDVLGALAGEEATDRYRQLSTGRPPR